MSTVYGKAADLLVEKGWTTGIPENANGCLCVGGAIAKVITGNAEDLHEENKPEELDSALHRFADFVGEPRVFDSEHWGPEKLDSDYRVYHWNDGLSWRGVENPGEHAIKMLRGLDSWEKSNG